MTSAPNFNSKIGETAILNQLVECPICLDKLLPPVFQCFNGHLLCESCVATVKRNCPVCREAMPQQQRIRNRAIEEIIKSQTHPCRFHDKGCLATVKYSFLETHQLDCPFAVLPLCSLLKIREECARAVHIRDFSDHLTKDHNIPVKFPNVRLGKSCAFEDKICRLESEESNIRFVIFCVPKASSVVVFVVKVIHESNSSSWTPYMVASQETATNYYCKIQFLAPDGLSRLSWTGQVRSLQSKPDDVTTCFEITAGSLRSICAHTPNGLVYKGLIRLDLK